MLGWWWYWRNQLFTPLDPYYVYSTEKNLFSVLCMSLVSSFFFVRIGTCQLTLQIWIHEPRFSIFNIIPLLLMSCSKSVISFLIIISTLVVDPNAVYWGWKNEIYMKNYIIFIYEQELYAREWELREDVKIFHSTFKFIIKMEALIWRIKFFNDFAIIFIQMRSL